MVMSSNGRSTSRFVTNGEQEARSSVNENDMIKNFMSKRDLPNWYRGLSNFQLDAADSLLTSIRDDSEQGTTHRVREDLINLGIEPVVSHRGIMLVMRLSRGSDLAFLWFLMELFYRTERNVPENKHVYNVNEQIIISAIAHLDTITTLREFDRLLPKPEPKLVKKKKLIKTKVKVEYLLPYFQKQVRPVSYGKKLTVHEVDNYPEIGRYDLKRNINIIIPNECNRWFADYKFDKSKRVTKRILHDQVNAAVEKAETHPMQTINPIFCAQHSQVKSLKAQMIKELDETKHKVYNKYLNSTSAGKSQAFKHAISILEQHIEQAKNEFQRLERNIDKGLTSQMARRKTDEFVSSKFDYGHTTQPDQKCKYFKAPSCNTPFKFKYDHIFDLGPKDPVKQAVQTALTGKKSSDISIDESAILNKCCKEMWNEQTKKYNEEYESAQKIKKKQPPPKEPKAYDIENMKNFNPKDNKAIQKVLLGLINEMKKNKKFVLASLPEAHKTPILKEFIKKRYGMVYTRDEKRKEFADSKKIFVVMKQGRTMEPHLPILDDLATERMVSYKCQKYLFKKSNFLRDKYYHDFKNQFLSNARTYWSIVRPYQCSNGPPIKEFFAYLPSRENDIHMFRPWRPNEFIPAKVEWDRRQFLKRQENSY